MSDRPLEGKHLILTQPVGEPSADTFKHRLIGLGARISVLPLVVIEPVSFSMPDGADYDWLFFTSKHGVRFFFEGLSGSGAEGLQALPAAVVGPSTAAVLTGYGKEPALMPSEFNARAMAMTFRRRYSCQGLRILWPCGSLADDTLPALLAEAGVVVTPLVVYRTEPRTPTAEERTFLQSQPDMLVFTSPSAVEAWFRLCGQSGAQTAAMACLGPKTAAAAHRLFQRTDVEANPSTFEGLAESIVRFYR